MTASASGVLNHDTNAHSSDTELFWALRGGGGGTWGVIISLTMKLHVPPSQYVHFFAAYPMYYNDQLLGVNSLKNVLKLMGNLPKEWGGYIVASSESDVPGVKGGYIVSLLHYGPWGSDSFEAIWPLYNDPNTPTKSLTNKTSFWDYEKDIVPTDVSKYKFYLANTFLQPDKLDGQLTTVIAEELFPEPKWAVVTCAFTMLGGE